MRLLNTIFVLMLFMVSVAFGQQVMQLPAVADVDTLHGAVEYANSSDEVDVIELTTSGGLYTTQYHTVIKISKPLIIRAAEGLAEKPTIQNTNPDASTRILFELMDGGSLTLIGLDLDGLAGTETNAKYLIRTDDDPQEGATGITVSNPYKLKIFDCILHDVVKGSDGNFFRAYKYTFADSVIIRGCVFYNCGKEGFRLKEYYDMEGTGFYQVNYFELSNCTFRDTNREAVVVYAGDNEPLTPAPKVFINHCTFYNCGYENSRVINAWDCDGAEVKNCIISHSPDIEYGVKLYGETSTIHHCDIFQLSDFQMARNAKIGAGMLYADPMYADAMNGDFTLSSESPVLGMADDGMAMGDLRWDPASTGISETIVSAQPETFQLYGNYPNPFNPETVIAFSLTEKMTVSLRIYNNQGQMIASIFNGELNAGRHSLKWDGHDFAGNKVVSGVYFCRLEAENQYRTHAMVLLQ